MPCDSSHLNPTHQEHESSKVRTYLREVGWTPAGKDNGPYGNVEALDTDTRALCDWCKANDVTKQSLELQIWWRDHQKADARKAGG